MVTVFLVSDWQRNIQVSQKDTLNLAISGCFKAHEIEAAQAKTKTSPKRRIQGHIIPCPDTALHPSTSVRGIL